MIRNLLEQEDRAWRMMGHIYPYRTLILEKGEVFQPSRFRGYGRRGTPQHCWSNAMKLTFFNPSLRYVEGLAIAASLKSIGFVTVHAWCVTEDGRVVDPTWKNPQDGEYMGVVLPIKEAKRYVLKKGFYGVLNNFGGEMVDLEAIEHFFPEYKGRDWRAEAETGKVVA